MTTPPPAPQEPRSEELHTASPPADTPAARADVATYLLIGLNAAVYAAMFHLSDIPSLLRHHAFAQALLEPFDIPVLARWGASASQFVHQGQWWRLLTANFIHVSLLHILLNLWCLWNLALFAERLLGRRGLIAVYLLTGTSGMIVSYAWSLYTGQPTIVAGASAAVFGLAGILIILLSNRGLAVPWKELRWVRTQVIFFAVINLAIGHVPAMLSHLSPQQLARIHMDGMPLPLIDNSAHLGGLLAGLLLGLPLFSRMLSGRAAYRRRQAITYVTAAALLLIVVVSLSLYR